MQLQLSQASLQGKAKFRQNMKLSPIKNSSQQQPSLFQSPQLKKNPTQENPRGFQTSNLHMHKSFSDNTHDRKAQVPAADDIPEEFCNAQASTYCLRRIKHSANLIQLKPKKDPIPSPIRVKGKLLWPTNVQQGLKQSQSIEFQGNFSGVFQFDDSQKEQSHQFQESDNKKKYVPFTFGKKFYFQGEVNNMKMYKIKEKDKQERQFTKEQKQKYRELTNFKGFLMGYFFLAQKVANSAKLEKQIIEQVNKGDIQYFLPAIVNFDIRKITQINLQKSLANLHAILKIQIYISPKIHYLLIDQTGRFKKKQFLSVDFHRSRPFNLPFYNQDDFENEEEETLYQWQDEWQGVDKNCEWIKEDNILSYEIRADFTAQIDNSFGIFYAPFNLNILRIIMDIHGIKIKHEIKEQGSQPKQKTFKLNITVCDYSDFNRARKCTPYINFNELERSYDQQKKEEEVFKMHIDRLTKINSLQFIDQGEFTIADNRLYLFPYHKRVFMNKNTLSSQLPWIFGTASRTEKLKRPKVKSVKQAYEECQKEGKCKFLSIAKWEFVHMQIPLFKYPVIDMIRIFVPITILSIISLLIFWQQNGRNEDNVTVLSTRIGSGVGILFAYVALIPTIRQNLPPSPAVTLVELLVIISVIPNFLAIISVFFKGNQTVRQFFATYIAFADPLFIISFVICLFSLLTLTIMMIIYSRKDYKTNFTIKKFKPSGLDQAKAPFYMHYMDQLRKKRKDVILQEIKREE